MNVRLVTVEALAASLCFHMDSQTAVAHDWLAWLAPTTANYISATMSSV